MKNKSVWRNGFALVVVLCMATSVSHAQIWVGPKAGFQGSRFFFEKPDAQELYNEGIWMGWNAGWVSNFDIVDGWSLAVDMVYSEKSRTYSAVLPTDIVFRHRATYSFIDISPLLRYSFGSLPRHYYVNVGPVIGLWAGGRGRLETEFTIEAGFDNGYRYTIVFDEDRQTIDENLWVRDGNRVQVGIEAGIGAQFDILYDKRIQVDLRYQMGHSNLGGPEGGDFGFGGIGYFDNFEGVHHVAQLSVAFLTAFEFKEFRDRSYLVK
ncbi:MAG: outer membrane beta-barrel protein [Bacteroidota bacterium]